MDIEDFRQEVRKADRINKIPDCLVILLYTITQPYMHSKKKLGVCRLPSLCMAHSFVISKES